VKHSEEITIYAEGLRRKPRKPIDSAWYLLYWLTLFDLHTLFSYRLLMDFEIRQSYKFRRYDEDPFSPDRAKG